jgi:hypothetical protein
MVIANTNLDRREVGDGDAVDVGAACDGREFSVSQETAVARTLSDAASNPRKNDKAGESDEEYAEEGWEECLRESGRHFAEVRREVVKDVTPVILSE